MEGEYIMDILLNEKLLNDIMLKTHNKFGDIMNALVLFGSYARGDFTEESDIDIAIILEVPRKKIENYYSDAALIMSDLSLEYDVLVNFSLIPYDEFNVYKESMPFYRNIVNEGVILSA